MRGNTVSRHMRKCHFFGLIDIYHLISIYILIGNAKMGCYCTFGHFWPIFHERVATRMSVRRLETFGSALERFNTEVFEKKMFKILATFLCEIFPSVFGRMRFFPCFSTYCMFQRYLKSRFSLIFYERVATNTCVSRLETFGSALEMFNTEVFEKKIFKIFATFFVRNFPLGFR